MYIIMHNLQMPNGISESTEIFEITLFLNFLWYVIKKMLLVSLNIVTIFCTTQNDDYSETHTNDASSTTHRRNCRFVRTNARIILPIQSLIFSTLIWPCLKSGYCLEGLTTSWNHPLLISNAYNRTLKCFTLVLASGSILRTPRQIMILMINNVNSVKRYVESTPTKFHTWSLHPGSWSGHK